MLAKNCRAEYFIISNWSQRFWKVSRLSSYVEHFHRGVIFQIHEVPADVSWKLCSPSYGRVCWFFVLFFFHSPAFLEERAKSDYMPVIIWKRKQMRNCLQSDFLSTQWTTAAYGVIRITHQWLKTTYFYYFDASFWLHPEVVLVSVILFFLTSY